MENYQDLQSSGHSYTEGGFVEESSTTKKEKKRLFQVLDEMNLADSENNTAFVAVCPNLVAADYGKNIQGTKVTMGVPGNVVIDLQANKLIPVLLLINREEYDKINQCF